MPLLEVPVSLLRTARRVASMSLLVVTTLPAVGSVARAADPAPDVSPGLSECVSANESSITLRGAHKLRQSRDRALVCAATTCPDAVRAVCRRRTLDLSAAIPTVVFVAKDTAGHDKVAVSVSMDGELLASRLDGTAIPVDPGQHTFSFEAAGEPKVEESFVISEGHKDRREIITFLAAATTSTASAAPTPAGQLVLTEPPATSGIAWNSQRIAAFATGGAGVLGIGLGAVFGGLASSDWSSAKSKCMGQPASCTTSPSSEGFKDESSASTKATVSTIGFIAGGALVAGGVTLFLTAPKTHGGPSSSARGIELVPAGGPGGAGLTLRGAF
jgi:hypothetical protein